MNCKDFQDWLLRRDSFTDMENRDACHHLSECSECKYIYKIDQGLEKNIQSAFFLRDIPRGLFEKIESSIDHAKKPDQDHNE